MPVVQVNIKDGRTLDQKRELVSRITDALVDVCGAARDRVHVIINEVAEESWGRGGQLLSDIAAIAVREKERK
ncbi:2-hydroxymuconate tautomerase [Mesorhizobium sp. B2-1-3A]|uniref:2-hydroxymuconate tautomerase n=1 Tax=Mesorhizobium sp. B2-1-3A TaxID=2589971 RepID=UPI00112DA6C0|nr:2-hydroxymuconate tautomerase [Mesorhizobium sp. B2-1-3A]TPM98239.1 4-oxalocrotonate tautomerase [Mesorhizobium sp. B2-1-3A]